MPSVVSVYYRPGKLPIRFPLCIGMIALARDLIPERKKIGRARILLVASAILLRAFAVLVIHYGHIRLPYPEEQNRE